MIIQSDGVLEELDRRLRNLSTYDGYRLVRDSREVEFIGISEEEVLPYLEASEVFVASLIADKSTAKKKLTRIIAEIPAKIFADGDQNKLDIIYAEKQRLVHEHIGTRKQPADWDAIIVPAMCIDEFASRQARGKTTADAIGLTWQTPDALALLKTWYMNTWLADWLLGQADIKRQDYEDEIDNATNESDIDSLVAQFEAGLWALVGPTGPFATNIAPGLIAGGGLVAVI